MSEVPAQEESKNIFLESNFESKSDDEGVRYIENFYKRILDTINNDDIIKALNQAAEIGGGENGISNIDFVSNLLKGRLIFKTTKEQRIAIFKKAVFSNVKR